jgi:hypothetical protein
MAHHPFFASFGHSMTSICAYSSYTTHGSRRPPCTARACRLWDSGVPALLTSSGCSGPRTVPCRAAPTNFLARRQLHCSLCRYLHAMPHYQCQCTRCGRHSRNHWFSIGFQRVSGRSHVAVPVTVYVFPCSVPIPVPHLQFPVPRFELFIPLVPIPSFGSSWLSA